MTWMYNGNSYQISPGLGKRWKSASTRTFWGELGSQFNPISESQSRIELEITNTIRSYLRSQSNWRGNPDPMRMLIERQADSRQACRADFEQFMRTPEIILNAATLGTFMYESFAARAAFRASLRTAGTAGRGLSAGSAGFQMGPPMEPRRLQQIIRAFESQGGDVAMDELTAYELTLGRQYGQTTSATSVQMVTNPSNSVVFEEFRHVGQFRRGIVDRAYLLYDPAKAIDILEVEAKGFLLRKPSAFGLTEGEIARLSQQHETHWLRFMSDQ